MCEAPVRVLVKLGGAAITRKEELETLNAAELSAACALLADASHRHGLVLVHGAGSFGHQHAAASRELSHRGPPSEPNGGAATQRRFSEELLRAFSLTRQSVAKLSGHVTAALLERGVHATALPALGLWTTRDRAVAEARAAARWPAAARALLPPPPFLMAGAAHP
jgi:isopentenyl phosphate kinase